MKSNIVKRLLEAVNSSEESESMFERSEFCSNPSRIYSLCSSKLSLRNSSEISVNKYIEHLTAKKEHIKIMHITYFDMLSINIYNNTKTLTQLKLIIKMYNNQNLFALHFATVQIEQAMNHKKVHGAGPKQRQQMN